MPAPVQDEDEEAEITFDDLDGTSDEVVEAMGLDDDLPPTEDIIKKLVDDEDEDLDDEEDSEDGGEDDDDDGGDHGGTPPLRPGTGGQPPRPGALQGNPSSGVRPAQPGSTPGMSAAIPARPVAPPGPNPGSGNSSAASAGVAAASISAGSLAPAGTGPSVPSRPQSGQGTAPVPKPSPSAAAQASAQPGPAPAASPAPSAPPKVDSGSSKKPIEWKLPILDQMLNVAASKPISDEELRRRAETIEQTLSSFGAPGRVVEVNQGPVITQFGVEPDYVDGRAGKRIKVKVGKISALADDLALALAAPSIRVEAPVPGKGFVGIEVPNAEPSMVSLRESMDTPAFRNLTGPLKMALGQDVSGHPIVADLAAMPHLLIAGTTGSGKSVCVNGIICGMLMTHTPETLKMIMVDPKRVELTNYNGIPHLMAPVVTELERIVGVLKWVQREMDERYRSFAMAGARNIVDFNTRVEKGQIKDGKKLAYIMVIVDELADLMMLAPDETERVITRLAQMARATGIHILISTQRPSVDVVTGLIKANFPARIAFAVATGVDSRVILDMPGAEKLLGRGDMLFQSPDAPMPTRMQGVFVSDREIQKIVDFWRAQAAQAGYVGPQQLMISGSGTGSLGSGSGIRQSSAESFGLRPLQKPLFDDDEEDGDVDDMFDEAVELVRDMEKASISLLQRHLRIGYTRAARLIDIMEERGVIGPQTGGSKPRAVLGPDGEPLGDLSDEDDEDSEP